MTELLEDLEQFNPSPKLASPPTFPCTSCSTGTVRETVAAGRLELYRRDLALVVPDAFAIPTCDSCGERFFTVELREALLKAQEPYFKAWENQQFVERTGQWPGKPGGTRNGKSRP